MMAIWFRSLLFNAGYLGGSAVLAVVMVPTLALSRRAMLWVGRVWAAQVNGLLTHVVGASIEFRGTDRIPPGPCLIAAKHQTTWEAIALLGVLPDTCYVLKKELSLIPVFGWYALKNRQIIVDRNAGARALKGMLRDARAAAGEGRQIVIFPEGTRVPAGETRDYQPGIAALYQALDLPVVPVAVNSGVSWARHSFVKYPAPIIAEFGEPLPPGLGRQSLMTKLQEYIEPTSRRLEAEARQALTTRTRGP